MPFTGPLQIELQGVMSTNTTQQHKLGARAVTADGREFRYGKAGASDLAPGKLAAAPAVVANHQNLAVAVAPLVGDVKVTATLGGTAATADQYKDGYLLCYDSIGVGQAFNVVGNSAQTVTTGNVDVYLADGLAVALTTASKVSLENNPYSGAVITNTAVTTDFVVGVPLVTVPAASFGWFQVRGVAAVLTNGTIAKGSGLIASATTAGAVDIEAAATITQRVGQALEAGVSTKYSTAYLTLV